MTWCSVLRPAALRASAGAGRFSVSLWAAESRETLRMAPFWACPGAEKLENAEAVFYTTGKDQ